MHIDHSKITADLNFVRSEIEQSTSGKVEIHGKHYATVGLRLSCLRDHFGSRICLRTKIVHSDGESITVKAEVLLNRDDGDEPILLSDGYANKSIKYVKSFLRSSLLEFCQTSAWGRALAGLGLMGDTDVIPSAEEIQLADGEELPDDESTIPTTDVGSSNKLDKEENDAFSG